MKKARCFKGRLIGCIDGGILIKCEDCLWKRRCTQEVSDDEEVVYQPCDCRCDCVSDIPIVDRGQD